VLFNCIFYFYCIRVLPVNPPPTHNPNLLIPPLLGFYAKLFVIASLANTANFSLAIFTILCSVIGCLRYLNIIQMSNMKMNGLIASANGEYHKSIFDIKSYIISIGTGILT